jgi:DNA-binding FadR family transcriptional regulator
MQVGNMTRPRVHQIVVAALARRILSGEIAEGEILPSMEELSVERGVSRSAMREAVKVLSAKGLVEVRPRIGTRVRPRSSWNLMDPEVLSWCGGELDARILTSLLQCRMLIEPGAAALAAANASAGQLARCGEHHRSGSGRSRLPCRGPARQRQSVSGTMGGNDCFRSARGLPAVD